MLKNNKKTDVDEKDIKPQKRHSQKDKIMAHLQKNGTISSLKAVVELGILRLQARISELRQSGHLIETTMTASPDGLSRYAVYSLKSQQPTIMG